MRFQVVFADSSIAGLFIAAAFFVPMAWHADAAQVSARSPRPSSRRKRLLANVNSLLLPARRALLLSAASQVNHPVSPPAFSHYSAPPYPVANLCL